MNTEQEVTDQQQIIATTIAMAVLADRHEWNVLTTVLVDIGRTVSLYVREASRWMAYLCHHNDPNMGA